VAAQKEARVLAVADLSALTRAITLEPLERLDFVGGQYLIVNSGAMLPDGKLAKRAYSIISPDARQDELMLAVRRIGAGPASSFMHQLKPGDVVPFSGPWGKFLADDARPRRATLIVATDTGITAALGLVRGAAFTPQLATARLLWLVEHDDYFLREEFVRARLPWSLPMARVVIPGVKQAERVAAARAELERVLVDGVPESVYLAGDGDVLYALRERLMGAGVTDAAMHIESFFNNPNKKSQ
jgi:ferredoxin-NADP reductase